MPRSSSTLIAAFALAVSILGLAGSPAAPAAPLRAESHVDKVEAQKKLAALNQKMEALAVQQRATAAARDSANAELAARASALAAAARTLHQTDAELTDKQQQLEQLEQQRTALEAKLQGQRSAIAELLRATYALGHGSDLRLLLGDEDVAEVARALAYSKYFQRDRVQRVSALMGDLTHLQLLQDKIGAEQLALQAARAKRQQQTVVLTRQRAVQQKLVAQTDAQYKDQAERLTALKQNAQSLNQLLARLQKAIDDAAREAAAQAAAERRRESEGHKAPPPAAVGNAGANIRGNLPWPASGAVTSFGNGVLIKAGGGSEVHAVARGRVIYAGYLRGYGMLLILNHGNGWMSMYGNNEALLHGVGDKVEAGAAVGTAAPPTGIHTGVYFELRQNGKPVDPRSWLSRHR